MAEVGQELTASTTGISDDDGPATLSFSYQWRRADDDAGTNAMNIGTDSSTYTPVAADEGKHIQVVVSYTDDIGIGESLDSAWTSAVAADTTPPMLVTATIDGATLVLTFNEALDETSMPILQVSVGGTEHSRTNNNVVVRGRTVTQTLATPVNAGDVVAVIYGPLVSAATPLRDANGNAADLIQMAVTNNTVPDTTPPMLQTATIDGATLVLTFDEALDTGSIPVNGDFTVMVGTEMATVSSVAIDDTMVTLTLAAAVSEGDAVTVRYLVGTNPIQDTAGNDAVSFGARTVENNTTPPLTWATMQDDLVYTTNGMAIDPVTLPVTTDGTAPYTYTLVRTNGDPSNTGLMLTPAGTNTLSGTPTTVATSTGAVGFTYTVTDANGATAMQTFTITLNPALDLGTQADVVYTADVDITSLTLPVATGGTGPYTYTLTGALPAGLAVSTDNTMPLTLTGMPTTAAAAVTLTYTATDNASSPATATQTFTVTVNPALTLVVDDLGFVRGITGSPLTLPEATGGTAPITYTLTGTLPVGLAVSTDNTMPLTLSGTPTTAGGPTTLTYTATDSATTPAVVMRTFTATVNEQPVLPAVANLIYTADMAIASVTLPAASRGTAPYTYLVVPLPAGLSFDPNTRILSGTPTTPGNVTVGYQARDSSVWEDAAILNFTITVNPALTLPAQSDAAFTAQTYPRGSTIPDLPLPEATGGSTPITYTLTGPNGMDLSEVPGLSFDASTRELSGMPTTEGGPTTLTYTATDSATGCRAAVPPTCAVVTRTLDVTITASDTTMPTLSTATVDGDTLVLTYNEALDGSSTPATGDFTVMVAGTMATVSSVAISDTMVTLTLSAAVGVGDVVTVTYTAGTNPVQDTSGNDAANLSAQTVTNNTVAPLVLGTQADVVYTADMAITPLTLPVATGGTGPYMYTLVGPSDAALGTAVPGLMFNPTTRVLSGMPTTAATAVTLTYTATDSAVPPVTAMQTFTVTVNPALTLGEQDDLVYTADRTITSLPLPAATGGTGPYTYTLTGTLPAGLAVSTDNTMPLTLSGTPTTAAAAVTLTYTVTDSADATAMQMFTITVNPALTWGGGELNDVVYTAGTAITPLTLLEPTGGTEPYTYTLTGPNGIDLSEVPGLMFDPSTRQMSGTPTMAGVGVTELTYTATDSATTPVVLRWILNVTVNEALTLPAQSDAAFNDQTYPTGTDISPLTLPEATGGSGDKTYTLVGPSSAALSTAVPGLSFNPTTRELSGMPTMEGGPTTLTYTATDSATGCRAAVPPTCAVETRTLMVTITDGIAPTLTTATVNGAQLVLTYNEALDGSSTPANTDFTIGGTATPVSVSMVEVSGRTVTLTLSAAVNAGDTVTLTYTVGTNPIRDVAMNNAAALSGETVTNNTGQPTISIAAGMSPVTEGTDAEFTVRASAAPASNLTVTVRVTEMGNFISGTAPMTVMINSGTTEATLTVPTDNDMVDEANGSITATVERGTGYTIAGTPGNSATVTVNDNDVAGITVNPTTGLTTTEAGGTATFTVVLDSQPAADVSIGVSSSDTGEGTVSTDMLTFTSGNWNSSQTVTVTGVDDDVDDGDQPYMIVLAAATSADTNYSGVDPVDVSVSNTDDDVALALTAPANQTYTVNMDIGTVTLPEATGGTSPYTYTLTGPSAAALGTTVPGLMFNANTRVLSGTPTMAVSSVTLTYTAMDSAGDTVTRTFTVTVNAAPAALTLPTVDNQTYTVNMSIGTVTLPEATGGTAPYTYALTGPSSAALGTAVPGLMFNASTRELSGTPTAAVSSVTLTYTAMDSASATVTRTFTVTVNAAAAALALTAPANQTYTVNMDIDPLTLPAATGGTAPYAYTLTGPSSATLSAAVPGLMFNANTRVLSGTPTMAVSSVTLTYTARDSASATVMRTFTVTVNAADTTAPTLDAAEVNGDTLVLVYDEALDEGSVPATTAFAIEGPIPFTLAATVRMVAISGMRVTLTLDATLGATDTVTVSYTRPALNPLRDLAMNEAFSLRGEAVTNNTVATGLVREASAGVAGRALVTSVAGGVRSRLHTPRGFAPISQAQLLDTVNLSALGDIKRMADLKQLLSRTDFAYALGATGAGASAGDAWAVWGRGNWRRLSGHEGGQDWEGDQYGFHLGLDRVYEDLLMGVMLGYHTGALDYRQGSQSGELDSYLLSVHPYLALSLTPQLQIWGALGYGSGEVETTLRTTTKEDLSLWTGSVGLEGRMETGGGTDAVVSGFVSVASTAEFQDENTRVYLLGIEAEVGHRLLLGGSTARPFLLVAGRHDGGDLESGTALEMGGGLEWSLPESGLSVSLRGRAQVNSTANEEHGASGELRYNLHGDGLGLQLSLVPQLGGVATMRLDPTQPVSHVSPARERGAGLASELGYGLATSRGLLRPHGRVELAESLHRFELGVRLESRSGIDLELDLERSVAPGSDVGADHAGMVNARLRF